eukprot:365522-Chlamydomonas_euryale.AAC.12
MLARHKHTESFAKGQKGIRQDARDFGGSFSPQVKKGKSRDQEEEGYEQGAGRRWERAGTRTERKRAGSRREKRKSRQQEGKSREQDAEGGGGEHARPSIHRRHGHCCRALRVHADAPCPRTW